jgi:hypothetical protein
VHVHYYEHMSFLYFYYARHDRADILLKLALNTNQSNQSLILLCHCLTRLDLQQVSRP